MSDLIPIILSNTGLDKSEDDVKLFYTLKAKVDEYIEIDDSNIDTFQELVLKDKVSTLSVNFEEVSEVSE
jgi:hypothetical protein